MIIAIVSDIHDNIWKLEQVKQQIHAHDCEMIIFCGDFCAPFSLKQLAENFAGAIHVVWGNNDGDKWLLTTIATQMGNVTLHGELAEIEVDEVLIGVNHYPEIAQRLAESNVYNLVCYGHNHKAQIKTIGLTRLVNPGEVMGRFGHSTFALYDTETRLAKIIEV